MDTEFVTDAQWERYARRVFNANIKRDGHSLSLAGIEMRANSFIVDIQTDHNGMIIKKGWREAMKGVQTKDKSVGKYGRYCCMCGLDLGANATFQQVAAHDCPKRVPDGQPLIPPNFCTMCGHPFHPGLPHPLAIHNGGATIPPVEPMQA